MLSDYYFTFLELFALLFLIGGAGIVASWAMLRRGRNRLEALERELADVRARYDSEYFQALHNHLQSVIAHEFVKGLDYISKKSAETLRGLEEEQNVLRDKQDKIIIKAQDLTQHAVNTMDVFALERNKSQKELLSIKQLIEYALLELYHYAESKGVILRPSLQDVEPTMLDKYPTLKALMNVIHNAIKYSLPGGVVETALFLDIGVLKGTEKAICIDVKDTGKGIKEQDQDKIFDLRVRGDGLIEPGSGLGLYCAREAARSQGGDVILVSSGLNQGSIFRIMFPYNDD
jgi:signal transduction histidine kinase